MTRPRLEPAVGGNPHPDTGQQHQHRLAQHRQHHPGKDPTEGKLGQTIRATRLDEGRRTAGLQRQVVHDRFSYYDGAGTQRFSHFSRPLSLTTTGPVTGPSSSRLRTCIGFQPATWARFRPSGRSSLGGPALTGNCCLAITVRAIERSVGLGVRSQPPSPAAPPRCWSDYPLGTGLGPGRSDHRHPVQLAPRFTAWSSRPARALVLFFGMTGTGTYCYGTRRRMQRPGRRLQGHACLSVPLPRLGVQTPTICSR